MQDCCASSALAVELLQFCAKLSISFQQPKKTSYVIIAVAAVHLVTQGSKALAAMVLAYFAPNIPLPVC